MRTRLRNAWIVIVAAAALAGCGGDETASPTTTEARPTIPAATADALAAKSEEIADALDAGDVCLAAFRADELLDATQAAIQAGQIPPEFQEELTGTANALVNEVNCPQPAETETEEESETTEDEDEKKEKEKEKKPKKDDDVLTIITEEE